MDFTLFYSKKCILSIKLLDIIKNNNISNIAILLCVDKNNIPNNILNIPAIITKNTCKPIYNNDCINFLDNIKYFNQTTNNINKNNVINININNDVLSYNKYESNNIYNNYTLLNDN